MCSFHCYEDLPTCGEGGIRTHGGPVVHNGFRDRPIQPLWHLSNSDAPNYSKEITPGLPSCWPGVISCPILILRIHCQPLLD